MIATANYTGQFIVYVTEDPIDDLAVASVKKNVPGSYRTRRSAGTALRQLDPDARSRSHAGPHQKRTPFDGGNRSASSRHLPATLRRSGDALSLSGLAVRVGRPGSLPQKHVDGAAAAITASGRCVGDDVAAHSSSAEPTLNVFL